MSTEKISLDALRIDRTPLPTRERPAWLLPSLIILAGLIAAGVWWFSRPAPLLVETFLTQPQSSAQNSAPATLLNASGYITARRASTVSSKVTGKVTEVLIEEGMQVKQGQILARLDHTNVAASLHLAEAQLDSSRKAIEEVKPNLAFSEKELKRFIELVAAKAASASDLNRVEAETLSLRARLAKLGADIVVAEREVASWQQQLEDTIIRSPFDGVVTVKNAQPGEMISPMSSGGFTRTGICTIVDMTSLEIDVDVNESHINRVKPGQPVQAILDSYPDWKIPAKVIAIIPTADRQKATVKVRVGIEQLDPRILPDMGVKVAFQAPAAIEPTQMADKTASPVITIPSAALHDDNGRSIVWVLRDKRIERRAVTVAQVNGDQATLSAGLGTGESVVTQSSAPLSDGAQATPSTP